LKEDKTREKKEEGSIHESMFMMSKMKDIIA